MSTYSDITRLPTSHPIHHAGPWGEKEAGVELTRDWLAKMPSTTLASFANVAYNSLEEDDVMKSQ